jgi:hypothetical protein
MGIVNNPDREEIIEEGRPLSYLPKGRGFITHNS